MLLGRTLGLLGSIGAMPPRLGGAPCSSPLRGWHKRGRGGLHTHVQAPQGCTRVCKAHPQPDSATWPPLEATAGAGDGGAGCERRSPRRARPGVISAEPQRGAGANRPFHPFSYRGDCSLFPVKPRREPAPSCWRREGESGGAPAEIWGGFGFPSPDPRRLLRPASSSSSSSFPCRCPQCEASGALGSPGSGEATWKIAARKEPKAGVINIERVGFRCRLQQLCWLQCHTISPQVY